MPKMNAIACYDSDKKDQAKAWSFLHGDSAIIFVDA